jgi:hypothetical protein
LVDLFRVVVPLTRRCGSAFPLGRFSEISEILRTIFMNSLNYLLG